MRSGPLAALLALVLAALPVRVAAQAPGTILTIAGTGQPGYFGDGGPATVARLYYPGGMAVDSLGNLFIADSGNHRVRKVSPDGTITTAAGTGQEGYSGDGGCATSARLNSPADVAVDGSGNLLIADRGNNRVRKVSPDGTITTVAGGGTAEPEDGGPATSARLRYPGSIAVDRAGNLFIAEPEHSRVRKVTPDGTITTVAGTGVEGFFGGWRPRHGGADH